MSTQIKLAPISLETMGEVAASVAQAVKTYERARASFLINVVEALEPWKAGKVYNLPITAAQYDKQFKPAFDASLSKKGVSEETAKSYRSKLKTVVLALLNNVGEPLAGESFFAFYDRMGEPLGTAKLADGSPVWEANKTGRKAKAKGASAPKTGGAAGASTTGGGVETGSAGEAIRQEGGMHRSPEMAAALILCKGAETRAEKLVKALEAFPAEFDKWAATILADSEKPKGQARKAA